MAASKIKTEKIQRQGYVVYVARTKREKSVAIKIEEGRVVMLIPRFLTLKDIHTFIDNKEKWILEKLAFYQSIPKALPKAYVQGEEYLFLGKSYQLKTEFAFSTQVELIKNKLIVRLPNIKNRNYQVKIALYQWYKEKAQRIIQEKINYYEEVIGVKAAEVRFKLFKSKWGSCHSNGAVDFNWFIICAPEHIIDYVVIHELTHLAFFSHSPKFWHEVEQVMPNYKKCEDWLKFHGHRLFV